MLCRVGTRWGLIRSPLRLYHCILIIDLRASVMLGLVEIPTPSQDTPEYRAAQKRVARRAEQEAAHQHVNLMV